MADRPANATPLPAPAAETPLLDWLREALQPMSRSRIKQLLQQGRVAVNGTPTTQFDRILQPDDRLVLLRESRATLPIAYEDESLIVVDKPPGLLTVATDLEKEDTAFVRLRKELAGRRAGRPYVVHRLDRETSGLVLFARSTAVRDALQANWDRVTKIYLAVVEGVPRLAEGLIENYVVEGRDLRVRVVSSPRGKRAVSRYKVVCTRGAYSLIEVALETGRKHQIRVHLAGLGCPVIGDPNYGARTNPARRLGLHAWRLAFDHPLSGRRVELESPLPPTLAQLVKSRH